MTTLKRTLSFAILSLLGAGLLGCYSDDDDDSDNSGVVLTDDESAWSMLEEGTHHTYVGLEDRFMVVRDAVAWSFLYHWINPDAEDVPKVDFSKDLVTVILQSARPTSGYSVSVVKFIWGENFLTNAYDVKEPPPTQLVLQGASHPYVIARANKVRGNVGFWRYGTKSMTVIGEERTYPNLVSEDYQNRNIDFGANPQTLPSPSLSISDAVDLESLDIGICPQDGEALVVADLGATGSYTDLANSAHFCPLHGAYYLKHTQGSFVATTNTWYGQFILGQHENSFTVEQSGVATDYDSTKNSLKLEDAELILVGSGYADPIPLAVDDEYSDTLRVVLDPAALGQLQTHIEYDISGVGNWNLETPGGGWVSADQVSFLPGESNTAAITHLFFYHSCFCWGVSTGEQVWEGTVTFYKITETRVAGVIKVNLAGNVPLSGNGIFNKDITLKFDQTIQ